MFLKSYTNFSDRKLIESANGNLHYQMFCGIMLRAGKACPDKIFILAPSIDSTCGCNDCSYMKLNSLQKLYICLKNELPEITLSDEVIT